MAASMCSSQSLPDSSSMSGRCSATRDTPGRSSVSRTVTRRRSRRSVVLPIGSLPILDALAAKNIPVLLTGMYAPPNFGSAYQSAFRAVFDRLGARRGVLYDPFFLEGVASVQAFNQGDGIHPNPEGVRRIVARLLPLVRTLVGEALVGEGKAP